jgi:hypothetical protein
VWTQSAKILRLLFSIETAKRTLHGYEIREKGRIIVSIRSSRGRVVCSNAYY